MSYEGLTPCPRCGHQSQNLVFCDKCGSVLTELPKNLYEPQVDDTEAPSASPESPASESHRAPEKAAKTGRRRPSVWLLVLAAMVLLGATLWYFMGQGQPRQQLSPQTIATQHTALLVRAERALGMPSEEERAAELDAVRKEMFALKGRIPADGDKALTPELKAIRHWNNAMGRLLNETTDTLKTRLDEAGGPDKLLEPYKSALAQAVKGTIAPLPDPGDEDEATTAADATATTTDAATATTPTERATPAAGGRVTPALPTTSVLELPVFAAAIRKAEEARRQAALAEGRIVEVTAESFEASIERADGLWVLEFYAEWNPDSRDFSKAMRGIAPKFAGKVSFGRVNVDAEDLLAARFNVSTTPMAALVLNGKILQRLVQPTAAQVEEAIRKQAN